MQSGGEDLSIAAAMMGTWYGILVGAVLWCIRLLKSPVRQRIWAILLACLFIVLFVGGAFALIVTYPLWFWAAGFYALITRGEVGYFVFFYLSPYVVALLLVVLVIADRDALDS